MPAPEVLIEVLGSGTSVGVPSIGCHCPVCTSTDPRDQRHRPSILLRYNDRAVLIDSGPDFRTQALRAKMDRLDAILYTHAHADHILGLDDVRPFNFRQRQPIPIYGSRETIATLRQAFRYIFETLYTESTIPKIETHEFEDYQPIDLFGLEFVPIPVKHGRTVVHGFRFGAAAYLTDHNTIPPESLRALENLDVLFVDGLRHREHPTHSSVKQALDHIETLQPRRGYLTHICHDLPHEETEQKLPPRVALSYDTMRIATSMEKPARVWRKLDEVTGFGPCALTIGNFDGVHRGHRELMRLVAKKADFEGWKSAVLTFDPHPSSVVAPERKPRLLTTPEERVRRMAEEGIQHVMILPFDREVAAWPPEEFVRRVLVDKLRTAAVIVGEDFRFGAKQAGDVALLEQLGRKYGFAVDAIQKVDSHRHHISSTLIRQALAKGDVGDAGRMLGRAFALEGDVVRGHGIGSKQTVPTLNMSWTAEIIPASGVYVTRTRELHTTRSWPSITNIGFRPTFDGEGLTIETYLLGPLDGPTPRAIHVEFWHRLREERKFPDAAALKAQILADVGRAQAFHRRAERWVGKVPVATLEEQ